MRAKKSSIKPKIGIYPGTFDPMTFGHIDIIKRSLNVVDLLVLAIADSPNKSPLFTAQERTDMVNSEIKSLDQATCARIEVCSFNGLLVKFAKEKNANVIIRGLRAVSDFEYEFQMSCVNYSLSPGLETVFLPATEKTHFIASRFVKEVARLGADVSNMVSANVISELKRKFFI